jgi:hypothetical protein
MVCAKASLLPGWCKVHTSALQSLFDFNGSNRRLVRWSLELQPYRDNMTIKYREGKKHLNVHPLSRAPLPTCNVVKTAICNVATAVNRPRDFIDGLIAGYMTDPYFMPIVESCLSDTPRPEFDRFILRDDGVLLFHQPGNTYTRLCVPNAKLPEPLQLMVLSDHHATHTAGHVGITKTSTRSVGISSGLT